MERMDACERRDRADAAYQDLERTVRKGHRFVLLRGPVGSGKGSAARRLYGELSADGTLKAIDPLSIAFLRQAVGWNSKRDRLPVPMFRAPHHTASTVALCGSDRLPGEVTLALHGVLLLDEISEFPSKVIHDLVHALSHGAVTVYRRGSFFWWPARPRVVVFTITDCPCGASKHNFTRHHCTCTPAQIGRHQDRISVVLKHLKPAVIPFG